MMQREVGSRGGASKILEPFAPLVLELAGPSPAARIWGGAEQLRDEIGAPIPLGARRRVVVSLGHTMRYASVAFACGAVIR
jgi:hypothetical protein